MGRDDGTPARPPTSGNYQIRMMQLEGMTNDSNENHREIASWSFELQAWFIIRDW
jgi:hypothetical protein